MADRPARYKRKGVKTMGVRLLLRDETLTARIVGEIDHHTARAVREEIDSAAQKVKPLRLCLDFTEVPFMDSSGVGLILGRYRLMQMWQGRVILCGLSPQVEKLVEISGLSRLVTIERGENHETHE